VQDLSLKSKKFPYFLPTELKCFKKMHKKLNSLCLWDSAYRFLLAKFIEPLEGFGARLALANRLSAFFSDVKKEDVLEKNLKEIDQQFKVILTEVSKDEDFMREFSLKNKDIKLLLNKGVFSQKGCLNDFFGRKTFYGKSVKEDLIYGGAQEHHGGIFFDASTALVESFRVFFTRHFMRVELETKNKKPMADIIPAMRTCR
jgi:hypothetical protein